MEYDAITFDAQTIHSNSFHFDGGLLAQLKQFQKGPPQVVVSEIVVREVLKSLIDKARAAKDSVESAHKKAVDYGLRSADMPVHPNGEPDFRAISRARWQAYLNDIGAMVLPVDDVSVRDLTRLYFSPAPPFSASGKKKNEFPDAIALLSLEGWAKNNGKRILAVSADGDWEKYATGSDSIDVVLDLGEALASLQKHAEEAAAVAQRLLVEIASKKDSKRREIFEDLLSVEISGHGFDGDAESSYYTEVDQVEVSYTGFSFLGDEVDNNFRVVQYDRSRIVIESDLVVNVVAEGGFSLSVYDSIDKDYVGMGSASSTMDVELEITTLITFAGDVNSEDLDVKRVEIVDAPYSIDFGYVEPDHGEDYYDE